MANRDRACPRSELIDALWPERPPAAADSALSALLSKLRRALGDGVLTGRAELRLRLGGDVSVDAEEAEAAVARAEAAVAAGRFADAAAAAREALAVDLPSFLPDAGGLWAAERRNAYESVRLRALEVLAAAAMGLGDLGAAEQAAKAAVAAAPFRESAHRALMEIHEAAGNPAEALRAFEELRVLLRDELGTSPGPAAMAVHQRLLRGEPAPTAATPPAARAWPVPLAAAIERHALVGRATELAFLERCLAQAQRGSRQLVLLAGDAGIGKTRAAAELARRAHDGGAVVLYGRFDEQTAAPYQPVVEMIRGWSGGASLAPMRERLGARAAELGILLPELGGAAAAAPGQRRRGRRAQAAVLRRGRGAARRGGRRRARGAAVRRPALGRPADAPAPAPPRPLAPAAAQRCSSAPTARRSCRPSTRCTSWSATCGARGRSSGSSSRAWARRRSASWSARSASARRRPASSRRCTARRRAIRSSSRRSSATCATRATGSARRSRSPRRGCPRACAR